MEKVLVITYYWPPSGGAGVQRILKFVKHLPQSGIKPYVVTVREDKASYPVTDLTLNSDIPAEAEVFRTDTFEPYNLYSKILGKKSIPTGFSNESDPGVFQKFSRFVRGNFFIPDARKGWIKYAFKEACRIIEKENIKTIVSTSPPHSAQVTGLHLKKKYKNSIRWIVDLRDPWTDIYFYNEFKHLPFAVKEDAKYEREVLENADVIITVSKSLKELFAKKSASINPEKIKVIHNGFDEDDFNNKNHTLPEDSFIITYTGTIAESYNPEIFFTALKETAVRNPGKKLLLRFIGDPASSLIEFAKNISLKDNIQVIPTVSHDESINYLLRSSALLLVIPEIKNDKGILTGKLFEYLAARKPIICIGPPDGDAAEIIRECNAGKTFDRTGKDEIINYLELLLNDRNFILASDNVNELYKKYSRRNQAIELAQILKTKF